MRILKTKIIRRCHHEEKSTEEDNAASGGRSGAGEMSRQSEPSYMLDGGRVLFIDDIRARLPRVRSKQVRHPRKFAGGSRGAVSRWHKAREKRLQKTEAKE